jgi:hypothetical protein
MKLAKGVRAAEAPECCAAMPCRVGCRPNLPRRDNLTDDDLTHRHPVRWPGAEPRRTWPPPCMPPRMSPVPPPSSGWVYCSSFAIFLCGSLLKNFVIGFLLDRLVLQTTHRAFRNDRAVFLAVTGDVSGPTRVVGERISVRRTSRERHCLRKMRQALRPYRS